MNVEEWYLKPHAFLEMSSFPKLPENTMSSKGFSINDVYNVLDGEGVVGIELIYFRLNFIIFAIQCNKHK